MIMEIKSILIKDTTKEERIRIVQEGLNQCGGACDFCNGCDNLGGGRVDSMIHDGTEPLADNFSALALVPGGVRVYFQPYQVAPWAAGTQRVFIPLEKLAPAGPLHLLWGE